MQQPMREEEDNLEIRSEEVQEILGTPPHWIVSRGTILAAVFLGVLIWLSFWLRYPDTVDGKINISFTEPPRRLIAQQANYVEEVKVSNNQEVRSGQTLLVFRSQADYNHVLQLRDLLEGLSDESDSTLLSFSIPYELELGELQENFFEFQEKQKQYARRSDPIYEQRDISSLQRQINSLSSSISYSRRRQNILSNQIDEAYAEKQSLNNLVRQNRASYSDVQAIDRRIESLQKSLQEVESKIRDHNLEISVLRKQINDIEQGADETQNTASDQLRDSFIKLKIRVEQWIKANVVQAPVNGIVQIVGQNVGEQQFVMEGEELIVILPVGSQQLLGRMKLDLNGSGKVREGQEVLIKLKSYPFQEYGAVVGRVSWKSKVPDKNDKIPVEVLFPRGLTTTTGAVIDPEEELYGSAEIIAEKKRFIERIFDRLQNLNI